ncbi:MAG: hypothetical protein Kow0029_03090 [Candidatus Rifleibacteriota bacterium]
MKINFRTLNKARTIILAYVIFCLLFPYNLMAATSETKYKVPKNSISYFVQNPTQEVSIVAPPEPVTESKPVIHEEVGQTSTQEKVQPLTKPAQAADHEEKFEMNWKNEISKTPEITPRKAIEKKQRAKAKAETKVNTVSPAPIVTQKIEKTTAPTVISAKVPQTKVTSEVSSDEAPFSRVLARMQQRSAERKAEAAKLGIVLPSQGGDINAVSPALSKINKTIKNIINRHHCPTTGICNFCR